MSADCVQDILNGLISRQCPVNGDPLVHRGTVRELWLDFSQEGWFRKPYTLRTVEESMTNIHQFAVTSGVFVNYVGPGPHTVVVPQVDAKGRYQLVKAKAVTILPDSEWTADGTFGAVAEDRAGNQFNVCGNAVNNNGLLHLVDVVAGAERWILTANGVGRSDIQRVRMLQGEIEWQNWIAKIDNGMVQQFEVSADAEQNVGSKVLARAYRKHAARHDGNADLDKAFVKVLQREVSAVRSKVSWLQPLKV